MQYILAIVTMLFAAWPVFAQIPNPGGGLFVDFNNSGGNTADNIVKLVVQALLGIVGLVSILFIVIGGFQYMTAGINEDLAKKGKSTLQKAITGLIIVILSYIIVVVVVNSLDRIG